MKFGGCAVSDAHGTILAHSVLVGGRRIRKGTRLGVGDISDLNAAGVERITVAQLAADDVHEDAAAMELATALIGQNAAMRLSAPFTGRVNIFADGDGLFCVDARAIAAFNAVDPSITVATLADHSRVSKRALLATIKIIPFATSKDSLGRARAVATGALSVARFKRFETTLILTELPGAKKSVQDKGIKSISDRMHSMGCVLKDVVRVSHNVDDLAAALENAESDLVLILTASATSDKNDVGPAALKKAGGKLTRFGMPVDPGNLLFLGRLGKKTIVGLPGCVRSPALNGADWVLERLVCGFTVTDADIAEMGVGGLLKEIPSRTQSRGGLAHSATRPHIEVILLAAGASTRMKGIDKLVQDVGGEPLLRRAAKAVLGADIDRVNVVLPPDNELRTKALAGLGVRIIEAPDWQNGMAASIRAGLGAVSTQTDAVIIALADMPEVTAAHLNALIAAFDPAENREICRLVAENGTPGHPVLFGRRFFESLHALTGDAGGRDIIQQAPEFTIDVQTTGQAVVVDLDTPEDWAEWRQKL